MTRVTAVLRACATIGGVLLALAFASMLLVLVPEALRHALEALRP